MAFSEPISSHVTLCHFATLCPMCCLQKVDKQYHEAEQNFLLYMAAVPYQIILKEGEKVRNCSFNLFGNSLFSLSNSNILASAKNYRSKSKIIELASAVVWNTLAIKLYMLARGTDFLSMVSEMNVLDGIFYKRKMFQPNQHWIELKYLGAIQNPGPQLFADVIMLFLNIRRHLPTCRRELQRMLLNMQVLTNHIDKMVEFNALDLVI